MRVQGVSVTAIARHFGVDYHTAAKALRWFGRLLSGVCAVAEPLRQLAASVRAGVRRLGLVL